MRPVVHISPDSSPAKGQQTAAIMMDSEQSPAMDKPAADTDVFGMATVDINELESKLKQESAQQNSPGQEEYTYRDLRGEMASASSATSRSNPSVDKDFDTLDEPVWHTVRRDLQAIGTKFAHVLYPTKNQALLKEWDLWGPLFICVFMALLLQGSSGKNDRGPQFTEIFVLTFFGACVVTLNIKLLGGTISFFQSLCVLGYCLLAPATSAFICRLLVFAAGGSRPVFLVRLLITVVGFFWATFASTAFLSGSQPARRKALAIYPIFLFYFVVSWIIISNSH